MNWVLCKFAVFLGTLVPQVCAAVPPDTDKKPQINNGAAIVDTTNQKFPVQTFVLNDEKQLDALYNLYETRESQVKDLSELGIHCIYSVKKAADIEKISELFDATSNSVSVFEIRFENDIAQQNFFRIGTKQAGSTIVISGASNDVKDITGVSFEIHADSVHVHHLKWKSTGIKSAFSAGAITEIKLDNLSLSDNKYEEYQKDIVEPRLDIRSYAKDGKLTNVIAQNLTFTNNKTKALWFIHRDSENKIGNVTFQNLKLENNTTTQMGIDVSASQKMTISNASVSGHSGSPLLVQRTSLGEVIIQKSNIPADAYQYMPLPKYMDKTAKAPQITP